MVIGFDLDDTINNLADVFNKYALKFNEENNICYEIQKHEWGFDKAFGWDKEDAETFLYKYLEALFKENTIKEKAKDVINKLYDQGHKILIITARSTKHVTNVLDLSTKWLKDNEIKYHELIIEGKNKVDKCKEKNVDIFIDDRPNNCEKVAELENVKVYMFVNEYNQDYINKDIERVYDWYDIEKQINNIENKK